MARGVLAISVGGTINRMSPPLAELPSTHGALPGFAIKVTGLLGGTIFTVIVSPLQTLSTAGATFNSPSA